MKRLLFTLLLTIPVSLFSQDSLFSKAYFDGAWSIDSKYMGKSLNDGLVIVGRYQFNNAFVLEMDSLGNVLWYNSFDYTLNQNTVDLDFIERTTDSAYFISGKMYNDVRNRWESGLIRLNNQGDTIWSRSYGLNLQPNCNGTAMGVIEDTNVLLAWTLENDNRLFLMKLDKDATILWSRELTGVDNLQIDKLIVANDSTVYVGAQNQTSMKARMIQFNGAGQVNWSKEYDQSTIFDMGKLGDGLVMLSLNYPTGFLDLNSIDYYGTTLWQNEYIQQSPGWTDWETPTMIVMQDSSVIICNPNNTMSSAVKVNSNGQPVVGAILEFVSNGGVEATNGGVFLLGNGPIYGVKSFTDHFGIIRVDSMLNGVQCLQPYSEPTPFVPFYTENNLTYTVNTGVNTFETNFTVSMVGMSVLQGCVTFIGGIDEINNSVSVYPMISNGVINFVSDTDAFVLTIVDQLGRQVMRDEVATSNKVIDLGTQAGVYYYRVTFMQSGESVTGKLLVR